MKAARIVYHSVAPDASCSPRRPLHSFVRGVSVCMRDGDTHTDAERERRSVRVPPLTHLVSRLRCRSEDTESLWRENVQGNDDDDDTYMHA